MSSKFVQLMEWNSGDTAAPRLMALDDDGNVWVYHPPQGWRKWQQQREDGANKPPVTTT